jgi:hypothetical protein
MRILKSASLMSIGVVVLMAWLLGSGLAVAEEEPENLFLNPSFEEGMTNWHMDKGGNTIADFTVDKKDAIDGKYSALVTIATIAEWGSQFGQNMVAGEKGKTYTFAVLAKSVDGPVTVDLQIERHADPWDRAAKSSTFTLKEDKWMELYVTFKVDLDFPEGWFAYISCTQPKVEYRADLFRLYEGEYIPYEELDLPPQSVSASARNLVTTWGEVKAQD